MRRVVVGRVVVCGAAVLALTGCGGGDGGEASVTTARPVESSAATVATPVATATATPTTVAIAVAATVLDAPLPAVTDVEVADLEAQLDEIDRIIADLEADLAAD